MIGASLIQMMFLFALAFADWGSEESRQLKGRQEDNAPSLPPPESQIIRETHEREEEENKGMAPWYIY